jgi:hypothetical protein
MCLIMLPAKRTYRSWRSNAKCYQNSSYRISMAYHDGEGHIRSGQRVSFLGAKQSEVTVSILLWSVVSVAIKAIPSVNITGFLSVPIIRILSM